MLEMISVVAISIVVSVVAVMSLTPVIRQYRVANAYNLTLAAMRQARDNAVSQRTSYSVTFFTQVTPPKNTITVAPTTTFTNDQNTVVYALPTDVAFTTTSPVTGTPTPDGYGTAANPIDFGYTASSTTGGQTVIYFCPDGSAQTASTCAGAGNWDGGVVYIAHTGDPLSTYAISLFGGTGRMRGWRFYQQGLGFLWMRQ